MKYRWGRVVGVTMRRSAVRSLVYILKCPSARNGTSDSPEGASLVCECASSIISPDEQVSSCVVLHSSVCKGNDLLMCRAHVHALKLQNSHTIAPGVWNLDLFNQKKVIAVILVSGQWRVCSVLPSAATAVASSKDGCWVKKHKNHQTVEP